MLNPTPMERLVNAEGQPYFLWDSEMTLEQFRSGLQDPDPEVRAYLAGKLMRQAKPDDVFTFLSAREIRQLWPASNAIWGRPGISGPGCSRPGNRTGMSGDSQFAARPRSAGP